jgi:high affinity sulfate transporter 1
MTAVPNALPSRIGRWLPGVRMLQAYQAAWLPRDLAAGLILGAVMVPVGLAFGELAGVPLAGLYAGIFPLIAYAFFGSSRQLIIGPDASMAAIVAVSVAPLAAGDPVRLAVLAGGLAVLAGLICIAGALLRLGFMADFLSKPVIVGFMHGLAVVIAVGQLPKVLGFKVDGETTLEQLVSVSRNIGSTDMVALTIGLGCVAIILGCRRWQPRIPGQIVALAAALLVVFFLGLDGRGLEIVGNIPKGLPGFHVPVLRLADIHALLPVALVAALVSFSDTMVTARGFASRNRYRVEANQELLAVGLGNIAAGLTQGLPVSASGSRTAVAESVGSRTQVTSIVAAGVVACTMLFLTDVLYFLPSAALGGILIAAAYNLCDVQEFRRMWHFGGLGLPGALLTMAGVIGIGVMEGIAIGVLYSLILMLRALAFPADAELGEVGAGEFHDRAQHADAAPLPGVVVYRFSAPLFFLNCNFLRNRIEHFIATRPDGLYGLVIDGAAINNVDLAGCEMLADIQRDLGDRGIRLALGGVRSRVRLKLGRGWAAAAKDDGLFFSSVAAAVRAMKAASIVPGA